MLFKKLLMAYWGQNVGAGLVKNSKKKRFFFMAVARVLTTIILKFAVPVVFKIRNSKVYT